MQRSKYNLFLILLFILNALPAWADGQTKSLGIALGIAYLLTALSAVALAFVLSFVFKALYEYTRKENRVSLTWMTLFTVLLPFIYVYAEYTLNWLYAIEERHGYEARHFINTLNLLLLTFIGFNLGYFMTVKKEVEKEVNRTKAERTRALLLQFFAWISLFGMGLYLSAFMV